ncbi:MAG: hypothetical protein HQL72_03015 [Magnetococcales bacterium]|nr:hypothetical protein [Magnetococcales bacterium]
MKNATSLFSILALATTLTLGAGAAQAGMLQVPHNAQDRVIVYTYKTQFAHPIDYWWHLNPSESGSWDYFSPVRDVAQPLPVERGTLPTFGTRKPGTRSQPSTLQKARNPFSRAVYGNPAVTGTPPAYQQAHY